MTNGAPSRLSDAELVAELKRLARCEREATVRLIVGLGELDARRLYLGAGFPSLFGYCTQVLLLAEHETYNRIEAARAARRFPAILEMLGAGDLNLATVRLLVPHLTRENHRELLAAARGRGKREVEELLARLFPQAAAPPSIRRLPAPRSLLPPLVPAPATPPPATIPLAPDLYQIRFTASGKTYQKLRLAQGLLRHAVPRGDTAEVVDRALTVLLEELARKKFAATERPREGRRTTAESRHIPAAVRRTVWRRDGGRCAFVASSGRRCDERGFLEFHHLEPYGVGGEATVENIQLRCRAHNDYEAELYYGPRRRNSGEGAVNEASASYRFVPGGATRSGTSPAA